MRDTQLKSESATSPNNYVKGKSTKTGKNAANSEPCFHSSKPNHVPAQSRFKDAICHKCQKKGHIAPVCQSKKLSVSDKKLSLK